MKRSRTPVYGLVFKNMLLSTFIYKYIYKRLLLCFFFSIVIFYLIFIFTPHTKNPTTITCGYKICTSFGCFFHLRIYKIQRLRFRRLLSFKSVYFFASLVHISETIQYILLHYTYSVINVKNSLKWDYRI